MRVLVACAFSGIVGDAFRERGHDAIECDLLPSDGYGPHIQDDIRNVRVEDFDLMIAHPPCTYLTNAGVRHLHSVPSRNGVLPTVHGAARWQAMEEAADFFALLLRAPVRRIAVENPIPHRYARDLIGDYNQCVQPWMFGDGESKAVCLWLRNLPPLERTHRDSDLFSEWTPTERKARVHGMSPCPDRAKKRSVFFPGIARAMAAQWGSL